MEMDQGQYVTGLDRAIQDEPQRPGAELDLREAIAGLAKEVAELEQRLTPVLRNRGMEESEISVLSEVGQSALRDRVGELHALRLRVGRITELLDL